MAKKASEAETFLDAVAPGCPICRIPAAAKFIDEVAQIARTRRVQIPHRALIAKLVSFGVQISDRRLRTHLESHRKPA